LIPDNSKTKKPGFRSLSYLCSSLV
jgi:hypothetical protein